jgi:hypothetical protein
MLFEDLDALAGNVSWRHAVMGNGTQCRPPMLVTAAVDEVVLRSSHLFLNLALCMLYFGGAVG